MKTKDAADYLGIPAHRLETIARRREVRRIMLGSRCYYEKEELNFWLEKMKEASTQSREKDFDHGDITV